MNRPGWQLSEQLLKAVENTANANGSLLAAIDADLASKARKAIEEAAKQNRLAIAALRPRITSVFEESKATVARLRQQLDAAMPANLRDIGESSALEDIVKNEGIPLAHVPRSDLVQELMAAADYEARRTVLASRRQEAIEDCVVALTDPLRDPAEDAIRQVAYKAVQALNAGHVEAAQALAVLASEQSISQSIGKYKAAKRAVDDFLDDEDLWFVAYYNAVLPLFIIPTLYTDWYPENGTPPPTSLSRHVTVHQVTADHLNDVNAVIAVLQVSGLVCAARWMQKQHGLVP